MSTVILSLRKVINVLFIGFVKFEVEAMVPGLPRPILFGLVSLDCQLLEYFFLSHFLGRNGFIFLLPARLCFSYLFNASKMLFCTYLLPNHVKYYLNSQNLHFKTQREKLCNDDVNCASVL